MNDEQDRNRYEWAQLTQGDYLHFYQQHTYASGGNASVQEYNSGDSAPAQGYAPVQGYAPAGAQHEYSACLDSSESPYGTSHRREVNIDTVDDVEVRDEEIRKAEPSRRQKRKSKEAESKEEQPKSRRAQLRERIMNETGEVSATDGQKGLVEWREGVFQWWDSEDKEWLKCAYHDQYRDQFLSEDGTEGYFVEPARGFSGDVTSACSAFNQLEWRPADRSSWTNVVDADGNQVLYLIERPESQSYDEPERLWIHDGKPVKPWKGLPRCLSSRLEGFRLEAFRRILPMTTIQDFRARMMRRIPTEDGIGAPTKPLSFPSTFGHRSSRFRALYQTPSWADRAASSVLKKQVMDLLPEAEKATTTEGLQMVSKYELERRKSLSRGKYLYKASGRALPEDERKKRDQKFREKLERQAAKNLRTPQGPQTHSTSPNPFLPTPPLSASNKRRADSNVDQSEPAPKRGRMGSSPLDPRSQRYFPVSQTVPEDSLRQIPKIWGPSSTTSTLNPYQGQPGSDAAGLGWDIGEGVYFGPQSLSPPGSDAAGLGWNIGEGAYVNPQSLSPPPQQPQAIITEGTASTEYFQDNTFQIDYRFVDPLTPLEQLRVQAALFYPRAHYSALIGKNPPHTSQGTYANQHYQLSMLLAQNWMLDDAPPSLADIGPWIGSFDMVPAPNLPDEVIWTILHPVAGDTGIGLSAPTTNGHAQGYPAKVGAENFQTAAILDAGGLLESAYDTLKWSPYSL